MHGPLRRLICSKLDFFQNIIARQGETLCLVVFLCLGNVGSADNQWGNVDMDFSDEFLVNNHIPVFSERLIYSSVIVIGGPFFPCFFTSPATCPIAHACAGQVGDTFLTFVIVR